MKLHKSTFIQKIFQDPIFSILPNLESFILENARTIVLPGMQIMNKNSVKDFLFYPVKGSYNLKYVDTKQDVKLVCGSPCIGLREVILEQQINYELKSVSDCYFLTLPIKPFKDYLHATEAALIFLKNFSSYSCLYKFYNYLKHHGIEDELILKIFSYVKPKPINLKKNTMFTFTEPALYIVNKGALRAVESNQMTLIQNVIAENHWFGEHSLRDDSISDKKYRALEDTEILKISGFDFLSWLRSTNMHNLLLDRSTEVFSSQEDGLAETNFEKSFSSYPMSNEKLDSLFPRADCFDKSLFTSTNLFENVLRCYEKLEDIKLPIKSIIREFSDEGLAYNSFSKIFHKLGFEAEAREYILKDFEKQKPIFITEHAGRLVLYLAKYQGKYLIFDGKQGVVLVDKLLTASEEIPKITIKRAETHFDPLTYVSEKVFLHKNKLLKVQFLRILSNMAVLSVPIPIAILFHQLERLTQEQITIYILLSASLFVVGKLMFLLADHLMHYLFADVTSSCRKIFFQKVLEIESQKKINSGLMQTQCQNFEALAESILNMVDSIPTLLIMYFGSVTVLSFINIQLGLVTAGTFLVHLSLIYWQKSRIKSNWRCAINEQVNAQENLIETIKSIPLIKSLSVESNRFNSFKKSYVNLWKYKKKLYQRINFLNLINSLLGSFCIVSSFIIISSSDYDSVSIIGMLVLSNLYVFNIIESLSKISDQALIFVESQSYIEEIRSFFIDEKRNSLMSDTKKITFSRRLSGHIEFNNVEFGYEKDQLILEGINFKVFPGEKIAIVGASGSGKSTIGKLILGELSPTQGNIFIDGFDVRSIPRWLLKKDIGFVSQTSQLYGGTIDENIAYGYDRIDRQRLLSSIDMSASGQLIATLPNQGQYYLSYGGLGLSGGESQRVALARTYYSLPNIYVFDETTASLDPINETKVIVEMKKSLEKNTVILISHRSSTLKLMDRIIVLKDGKIVENDSHKNLLKKDGEYSRLFFSQKQTNLEAV